MKRKGLAFQSSISMRARLRFFQSTLFHSSARGHGAARAVDVEATRRPMVAGYIIDYVTNARRRRAGRPPNKEMPHNFVLCHVLSPRVKWAFWLTNLPYWYLCRAVVRHQLARRLGASSGPAPLWLECLRPVCGSSEVHGACVFVIAAASTAFHGFQLQLDAHVAETCGRCCAELCGLCGLEGWKATANVARAGRERKRSRNAPASALTEKGSPGGQPEDVPTPTRGRKKLVERLLLCDVLCANAYVAFLMTCASAMEVVRVSIVPVGCMFVAAQAKRRRKYNTYVVFHGLWHLGSAWAIYNAFR